MLLSVERVFFFKAANKFCKCETVFTFESIFLLKWLFKKIKIRLELFTYRRFFKCTLPILRQERQTSNEVMRS